MSESISHAFVLPDQNFTEWFNAVKPYTEAFERVAVIRGPAGNDLNRFRNVTAVETPLMWVGDDALAHIRRAYPMVVRVDVVRVQTPRELESTIQARIANDDRYGAQQNDPVHLYERFTLQWPCQHRPARIIRAFSKESDILNEGIDILTESGSKVLAAATGMVAKISNENDALGYGGYVQISTTFRQQPYTITYGGLQNITAPEGQPVKFGDAIGEAAGDSFKLVVQAPGEGLPGFKLPDVVDPTPMIYWLDMRVRPTADGLRVRSTPNMDGEVLKQFDTSDTLESMETHGRTLLKVGVEGQWLPVRLTGNERGHAAAWYLEVTGEESSSVVLPGVNPVGVNLDIFHPMGRPAPSQLGGIGWVRFGYNVSAGRGSEDINAAYQRYEPIIRAYAETGYKVVLAFSHQTYGEGKSQFWPWTSMTAEKWGQLIPPFVSMVRNIAQQYAGKNIVHAWQVWNEQDAPSSAVASVPMSAQIYAKLLAETVTAIRSVDKEVFIITGGHTGGPGVGANYARETIAAMPRSAYPDGIAFHPYGRGASQSEAKYRHYGSIGESIQKYGSILPGKPLWITEWGVLNAAQENPADIGKYALEFISHVKARYGSKVAVMIWYAWAQGMHNGYGITDTSGNPRPGLTSEFLGA